MYSNYIIFMNLYYIYERFVAIYCSPFSSVQELVMYV